MAKHASVTALLAALALSAVLGACTAVDEPVSQRVTPAYGATFVTSGVIVEIPPGAVTQAVDITLSVESIVDYPSLELPDGAVADDRVFAFDPDLPLGTPASVILSPQARLPIGAPATLQLFTAGGWSQVEATPRWIGTELEIDVMRLAPLALVVDQP